MIEVNHVSFQYGEVRALYDVTMEFTTGSFISIVGPNGSGKTTLSRCMAGFLRPKSGSIRIDGINIQKLRPRERVQLVGYVFQNPDHQLFKETVEEEVLFGLANIGVRGHAAAVRVTSMLERLELDTKRHIHPFRLARGDRQRLAIAAVAVLEPRVLIVDEPTTGQDPVRAREIMDVLRDLNRGKGTTLIVVTHAMDLVAEYAVSIVAMASGTIVLSGPARDVFRQAARSDKPPISPPPIVRLGIKLGLDPLPLTIEEFVRAS